MIFHLQPDAFLCLIDLKDGRCQTVFEKRRKLNTKLGSLQTFALLPCFAT